MPELPEVETVMRGMERALDGLKIINVDQRRADLRVPFPDTLQERMQGERIDRFQRRAKYILVTLSSGEVFVLHLGMSGRVLIVPDGGNHQPEKHDHLVMDFENGTRMIYRDPRRFGMVFLLPEQDLDQHKAFKALGPEPLGNDFSGPILYEALRNKKANIKSALLDQRVVSGLGNIYVCEALYTSGIHPESVSHDIGKEQAEILVRNIRKTLEDAIKAGGSTLKDYRHTDDSLGYFQHRFAVYDREKLACPDCECDIEKTGGVQRMIQSGRSTFYCPVKQSKR